MRLRFRSPSSIDFQEDRTSSSSSLLETYIKKRFFMLQPCVGQAIAYRCQIKPDSFEVYRFRSQKRMKQNRTLQLTNFYCRMLDVTTQNLADQKSKEISVDRIYFQLMENVGTSGRYQIITTFILSISAYLCGGLLFITPFLFYQEPYVCDSTYTSTSCLEHVCSVPISERLSYLPLNVMSTLTNDYGDYRCEDGKAQLNLIQTLMYSSSVLGYLLMTLLGGVVGRKMLMLGSLFVTLIGLLVTVFCVNIVMAGVGMFISYVGIQNCFNICFYFLSETVAQSMREKCSVIVQLFYGFGLLVNVGAFYWIHDWKLIFWLCYFTPGLLVFLSLIFFVRDTPICLVMRQSSEKAVADFAFIAKINGISESEMQINTGTINGIKYDCSIRQNKKEKVTFSLCDLFRYKSLQGMTLILICLQSTVIFEFYAPALMIDQFKLNIFINGIVVAVSQIVAYPLCYCLITCCKRKHVAYVSFIVSFICSFALIFIWKNDVNIGSSGDIGSNIGVLVLVFLFRFAITVEYTFFIIYYNELYPTQIRVQGTGLVSVSGGVLVTVIPYLISVCQQAGFPIMILFCIMSAFSMFLSYKLPETYERAPQDVIDELRKRIQARSKRRISLFTVYDNDKKDDQ